MAMSIYTGKPVFIGFLISCKKILEYYLKRAFYCFFPLFLQIHNALTMFDLSNYTLCFLLYAS